MVTRSHGGGRTRLSFTARLWQHRLSVMANPKSPLPLDANSTYLLKVVNLCNPLSCGQGPGTQVSDDPWECTQHAMDDAPCCQNDLANFRVQEHLVEVFPHERIAGIVCGEDKDTYLFRYTTTPQCRPEVVASYDPDDGELQMRIETPEGLELAHDSLVVSSSLGLIRHRLQPMGRDGVVILESESGSLPYVLELNCW